MSKRPLVDFTFGIKSQAVAVLHELNAQEEAFEADSISTRPWYNGREKGIVLIVQVSYLRPALCVAFFEHRSSDNIEVHQWEQPVGINSPTGYDTCNQMAYETSLHKSFDCGHASDAAYYIVERVTAWVKHERAVRKERERKEAEGALAELRGALPGRGFLPGPGYTGMVKQLNAGNDLKCGKCNRSYKREVGKTGTRLCRCGAPVDANPGHVGVKG